MRANVVKIVSLLLTVILLFALSACSSKQSDEGMTTTEAGTTEEQTTVAAVSSDTETDVLTTASESTIPDTTASESTAKATDAPTQAPTSPQTAANDKPSTGSFSSGDLSVSINGVRMRPNTAWSSYSDSLGSPSSVTQAPSCHFDGMDNIYEYGGFSIYTYRSGGEDYVYDIEISSSSIATDKGIRVGSSADDVLAAYGDGYATYSDAMIEYRSGSQSLYFSLSGGTVSLIEFYSE